MAATRLIIDTIVSDPAIRGGRATLAGRSITVADIAIGYLVKQYTVEEIAMHYALSLAQVYAALSYYYANKTDIDAQIERDDANAEKLLAELREQGKLIEFGG